MIGKNKIIKSAISLGIVLIVLISLIIVGCNLNSFGVDTFSETFNGYISNSSYNTKSAAAEAYIENELTGVASKPVYLGYNKVSELSSEEIEKLSVSEFTQSEILSVESVEIEYKESTSRTSETEIFTTDAYFVNTTDGYYYFVDLPKSGERLPNSYFETVLDGSKYLNCTATTTLNLRIVSDNTASDSTYKQEIILADDKVYFNQSLPGYVSEIYMAEDEYGLESYLKNPLNNDGKFYSLSDIRSYAYKNGYTYDLYFVKGGEQVNIDSLTSVQDITDLIFMLNIDASYFTKTDYGFSMSDYMYKEICKEIAGDSFASDIEQAWEDYHINFRGDYYVTEGRLSAMQLSLTMSDGANIFALSIESKFTDFGTSVVNLPEIA